MAPNKDMRRQDLSKHHFLPALALPLAAPEETSAAPRHKATRLRGNASCAAATYLEKTTEANRNSFSAVVPFQEPKNKKDPAEFGSTLASTMPMAAMFTRNKFVGW